MNIYRIPTTARVDSFNRYRSANSFVLAMYWYFGRRWCAVHVTESFWSPMADSYGREPMADTLDY